MESPRKPTAKELRFVEEYLVDCNATRATERAGYSAASEEALRAKGSQLLKKLGALIAERMQARAAKIGVKAEEILREADRVATSDIRRVMDDEGRLLPVKDWPDDIARAVASIEVEELYDDSGEARVRIGRVTKLKLWSKTEGISLASKHRGLLIDKREVTGTVRFVMVQDPFAPNVGTAKSAIEENGHA